MWNDVEAARFETFPVNKSNYSSTEKQNRKGFPFN
jgi:hypothetical protein